MALQLKLNCPNARQPSVMKSAEFLRTECHSRLMWTIFVSDLLYAFDGTQVTEQHMADLYLPCNLWSFTQGSPSTTLRLAQISDKTSDTTLRQATNPCAYFIKILTIRRKIIKQVSSTGSSFSNILIELIVLIVTIKILILSLLGTKLLHFMLLTQSFKLGCIAFRRILHSRSEICLRSERVVIWISFS